jgi:hypothetical protein
MMSKERPLRSALVVLVLMTSAARAQSPAEQADVQFQRGKDLLSAGRIAEACSAFDEAQRLDPTPATLLNQANCRERNGELATAHRLFLEAARQTRGAAGASRSMYTTATERAARLAQRVSTLRIAVATGRTGPIEGLEVLRDGEVLDPASWGQAVAVDGGTHTVSARAPGRSPWTGTVIVAVERDIRAIEVPELQPAPPRAAPAGSTVQSAPAVPPPSAATTGWTARRKVALGVGAGAIVALGAAGALGASALQRQRDAHALCPDPALPCDGAARATALSRLAHDHATVANVAYGVAAGAAAAAAILWLTGAPAAQPEVALVPAVSPGQFVVTASRSW